MKQFKTSYLTAISVVQRRDIVCGQILKALFNYWIPQVPDGYSSYMDRRGITLVSSNIFPTSFNSTLSCSRHCWITSETTGARRRQRKYADYPLLFLTSFGQIIETGYTKKSTNCAAKNQSRTSVHPSILHTNLRRLATSSKISRGRN